MSKALERRAKLRESLIQVAERSISAAGLAGLKTRELAREIGVANGAVWLEDLIVENFGPGERPRAEDPWKRLPEHDRDDRD